MITVALRVVARKVAHLKLWWDDWILIAATVGTTVPVEAISTIPDKAKE